MIVLSAELSICNTFPLPSLTANVVPGVACESTTVVVPLDELTINGIKDSTLDDEPPSNLVLPYCEFNTISTPVIPARDALLTPIAVLDVWFTSNIFFGPAPDASSTISEPLINPAPF